MSHPLPPLVDRRGTFDDPIPGPAVPIRPRCLAAAAAVLALLAAAAVEARPRLRVQRVASGLDRPVAMADAGDGSERLFVVEQSGAVRIVGAEGLEPRPFLDLASRISCCGERGLLGLAFHPDYSRNGRFYVYYTDPAGDSVVARFLVSDDPDRADPDSESIVLTIDQPRSNHNGGHLAFGPDGHLYIATGDGGGAGDPDDNAQRLDNLLGKILRIDVDSAAPYLVPADNPFVSTPGAMGEIWVYGLRNPWKFSFDRAIGDLWIGDVGQSDTEEIDRLERRRAGGQNFGWRIREGSGCFDPPADCPAEGLTPPVLEYDHRLGCSVTGGFRHRGDDPVLERLYLFGDFCSGQIWAGVDDGAGGFRAFRLRRTLRSVAAFGEDASGRIYLVDYQGALFRLSGQPEIDDPFEGAISRRWRGRTGDPRVVAPGLAGSVGALGVDLGSGRVDLVEVLPGGYAYLRLLFRFDAGGADLAGERVEIARLGSGGEPVAVLEIERAGRRLRALLSARDRDGSLEVVARSLLPATGEVELEIEAMQSDGSGPEANGFIRLNRDGKPRGGAARMDSGEAVLTRVRLGLPSGSPAGASGTLRFDDVTLTASRARRSAPEAPTPAAPGG